MFFGWMFRFLRSLSGVLVRFMPCETGGDHCRLRHIGWELSGHGLISRPREIDDPRLLCSLFGVFGYPRDCGADLLEGFFVIAVLQG